MSPVLEIFLFGLAAGLGLAAAVARLSASELGCRARAACRYRWVTRPSRVREVRRTTQRAMAHATAQSERPKVAVGPDDGNHPAGDRALSSAPASGVFASWR